MPTELRDETGELIRERAHEYGATTGRPRRCGWFDAVISRFSARVNGFSGAALTRLDVLDIMPSLKICTGYRLNGDTLTTPPRTPAVLPDVSQYTRSFQGGKPISAGCAALKSCRLRLVPM